MSVGIDDEHLEIHVITMPDYIEDNQGRVIVRGDDFHALMCEVIINNKFIRKYRSKLNAISQTNNKGDKDGS